MGECVPRGARASAMAGGRGLVQRDEPRPIERARCARWRQRGERGGERGARIASACVGGDCVVCVSEGGRESSVACKRKVRLPVPSPTQHQSPTTTPESKSGNGARLETRTEESSVEASIRGRSPRMRSESKRRGTSACARSWALAWGLRSPRRRRDPQRAWTVGPERW